MSDLYKYIILSDGTTEYPIIFHPKLSHVCVSEGVVGEHGYSRWSKILMPLQPVAAGFCSRDGSYVNDRGSESLQIGPRPQDKDILSSAARKDHS